MTRDEAMRGVVEAARASLPRGGHSLVWSALDRLDALDDFTPGEPEGRVYSETPSVGTVRVLTAD